jgi:hypothetical protein
MRYVLIIESDTDEDSETFGNEMVEAIKHIYAEVIQNVEVIIDADDQYYASF